MPKCANAAPASLKAAGYLGAMERRDNCGGCAGFGRHPSGGGYCRTHHMAPVAAGGLCKDYARRAAIGRAAPQQGAAA